MASITRNITIQSLCTFMFCILLSFPSIALDKHSPVPSVTGSTSGSSNSVNIGFILFSAPTHSSYKIFKEDPIYIVRESTIPGMLEIVHQSGVIKNVSAPSVSNVSVAKNSIRAISRAFKNNSFEDIFYEDGMGGLAVYDAIKNDLSLDENFANLEKIIHQMAGYETAYESYIDVRGDSRAASTSAAQSEALMQKVIAGSMAGLDSVEKVTMSGDGRHMNTTVTTYMGYENGHPQSGDVYEKTNDRDSEQVGDRDIDDDGTRNKHDDDMDGDGIPNDEDSDQDGDGVNDEDDCCPNNPKRDITQDSEGRGINQTDYINGYIMNMVNYMQQHMNTQDYIQMIEGYYQGTYTQNQLTNNMQQHIINEMSTNNTTNGFQLNLNFKGSTERTRMNIRQYLGN